jgi:tetratricopeptide (TPR) repeat protein
VRRIGSLWFLGAVAAGVMTVASAGELRAQAVEESRLLREAASRESTGDFDGAQRVLLRLLEVSPGSSGGLFALERVLRAKGDTPALLPVVDAFLARDPNASGVRHLKLRVLLEVDSLQAVEAEAERWFRAQPTSETAYREVSRIFERAFGPERALAVLERGRSALGRPGVFALETGDVLAAMGRRDAAVQEWAVAVGDDGAQAAAVGRRVAGLPDDPKVPGRALVDILGRSTEPGRRRAAVQIAVDLGLPAEALSLSRRAVEGLDDRLRSAFLADVARRAREADMGELASWAYGELGQNAASPAERRQFDQRLVELSLAAGDTVAALEAQHRLVASYTEGSADHRRASAQEVRLQSGTLPPEALLRSLQTFEDAFPEAPELDEIAAHVAGALIARGEMGAAEAVLIGLDGPRSSLQRGYLLLDAGRAQEARQSFLLSLPGLEPSEATEVIQFVALLGRLSPEGGAILARAAAIAHQGRGGEAADSVVTALAGLPPEEHPPLLAEAARLADQAGATEKGASLRVVLLRDYPDSREWAEASLTLARFHAAEPEGREKALRLLEDLVVRSPNAAVVPDARRELERLRRAG